METFPHPRSLLLLAQNLPPLTPFPSAANMRSFHTLASTHVQSRPWACVPCVALAGTTGASLSLCPSVSHASTFLPPVPRRCFTFSASCDSSPLRYHEGSDSAPLTYGADLPAYFLSFHLQPRELPGHRFPPRQRDQRFSDFALVSQARRSSPPNRVVILRTETSPLVALHPASQRRSFLRLRSLWLFPTRTFNMLMWRPHGRTIPAFAGMTVTRELSVQQTSVAGHWFAESLSSQVCESAN